MSARFWDADFDPATARVSVVTPTHNRLDLLERAVRSVVAQDHPFIEHVIVGDACPALDDARAALVRIRPDLRIHNLDPALPRPAYGPARIGWVRNAGIARCTGDFIAHLDDDNTFDPDHVSSLLQALHRQPDAAIATSYRKLLLDGGRPYTLPYHPWSGSVEEARRVWAAFERMGLYQPGDHRMRDRVSFHEERDCTVDANELMVRREVHERFLFPEALTPDEEAADLGDDDVFCERIYRAGHRVAASGRFSLNFRLGGRFTELLLSLVGEGGGAVADGAS